MSETFEDGKVVATVEIRPQLVEIRQWYGDSDQDLMFDWFNTENGDESSELFSTVEDAVRDAEARA